MPGFRIPTLPVLPAAELVPDDELLVFDVSTDTTKKLIADAFIAPVLAKANASAIGIPGNANDMGVFAGTFLPDNISAKDALQALGTGFDNLGSATGSSMVGFLQAGAGAVLRTSQDKMRDIAHAFDFLPTSIHDAIVAGTNLDPLADELNAILAVHRRILIPVGVINIEASLFVPSGGGIVGLGGNSVIKALPNFGGNTVALASIPLIRNSTYLPADAASRDKGLVFRDFRIDGNRAAQQLTEYQHGIQLNAVDGVDLNLWIMNNRGDGVNCAYARGLGDGAPATYTLGCRGMQGFVRSDDAYRQGVSVTCGEDFNFSVLAIRSGFYGFDVEPDSAASYVRDGFVRLVAIGCSVNGATGGGIAVGGTNSDGSGAADVRDIMCDLAIRDCAGSGVFVRDANNVSFRGEMIGGVGAGTGFNAPSGAFGPSTIVVDLSISGYATPISTRRAGNIINGRFRVTGGSTSLFDSTAGGTVYFRSNGATAQALQLLNANDMTFPDCDVINSVSSGVFIRGTSSRNRFPNLHVATPSNAFGYGLIEEAGMTGSDNRATNARLSGGASAAPALLVSPTSFVSLEPLVAKAALTFGVPGAVPGYSTCTAAIAVPGTLLTDEVTLSAPAAPAVNYAKAEAYVSAAGQVTVRFLQVAGAAAAAANGTFGVSVQRTFRA